MVGAPDEDRSWAYDGASSFETERRDLGLRFLQLLRNERRFLVFLGLAIFITGATYDVPPVARWVGFLLASYAAVANDSIQTIGTFIASNRKTAWWKMWLFIGGIFLATVTWSWFSYSGDVSYQRLASKGFAVAPAGFSFLQVAAPIFLILLTRLKMPVSTTFLLLSSFATEAKGLGAVLTKSLSGYVVAFVLAIMIWFALSRAFRGWFTGTAHPLWRMGQWLSTGVLWSVWVMQDAANIAVYLPRSLDPLQFAVFAGVIFLGLGLLFRMGGERIQEIVDQKSDVMDVRPATVIDFIYAIILFVFQTWSTVPMSTTWVFLGLLGGRELAMSLRHVGERTWRQAIGMLGHDLGLAMTGLAVSLVLAAVVNPTVRTALLGSIGF